MSSVKKRRRPEEEGREEEAQIEHGKAAAERGPVEPSPPAAPDASLPAHTPKKRKLNGSHGSDNTTLPVLHPVDEIPNSDASDGSTNATSKAASGTQRSSGPDFITSSPMNKKLKKAPAPSIRTTVVPKPRRLSDEFEELASAQDAPVQETPESSTKPTSLAKSQTIPRIDISTVDSPSQDNRPTESAPPSHRSDASHNRSTHHASMLNPHGDQEDENNTSIMDSIFSPGFKTFVTKKFHELTSSLGIRSSQELAKSSSSVSGDPALAGEESSTPRIRLPAANGIHHPAYRTRPHHGLTPGVGPLSASAESTPRGDDVVLSPLTPAYGLSPLTSSQLVHSGSVMDASSTIQLSTQSSIASLLQDDASQATDATQPIIPRRRHSLTPVRREEPVPDIATQKEQQVVREEAGSEEVQDQEVILSNDDYINAIDEYLQATSSGMDVAYIQVEEEEDVSEEEFDSYLFMATVPPLESLEPAAVAPPGLPRKSRSAPKVTLVLDLDETLVHCSLEKIDNPDLIFAVPFEGEEYQVYVRKRPGFEEFLTRVSELFEVAVFTASQRAYADKLLNILDPAKKWIHHRLFRESCVFVLGNYLKDLNVLGRELSRVIIVDNSPHVFAYQLDNGVPIESWFNDSRDRELLHLLPFLESLAKCSDVRPIIRSKFQIYKRVEESQRAFEEVTKRAALRAAAASGSRLVHSLAYRPIHQTPQEEAEKELLEELLRTQEHSQSGDSGTSTPKQREPSTKKRSRSRQAPSPNAQDEDDELKSPKKKRLLSPTKPSVSPSQSIIEGENDDDDVDERSNPAPTPRRKARVRSRVSMIDDAASDTSQASEASSSANLTSSTKSRRNSTAPATPTKSKIISSARSSTITSPRKK